MMMNAPSHPGEIIRDILEDADLTVTKAAECLAVTRQTLNNLVNQHSGISPEMALRLEAVFGSTADAWMRMQARYDLSLTRQKRQGEFSALKRLETAQ